MKRTSLKGSLMPDHLAYARILTTWDRDMQRDGFDLARLIKGTSAPTCASTVDVNGDGL